MFDAMLRGAISTTKKSPSGRLHGNQRIDLGFARERRGRLHRYHHGGLAVHARALRSLHAHAAVRLRQLPHQFVRIAAQVPVLLPIPTTAPAPTAVPPPAPATMPSLGASVAPCDSLRSPASCPDRRCCSRSPGTLAASANCGSAAARRPRPAPAAAVFLAGTGTAAAACRMRANSVALPRRVAGARQVPNLFLHRFDPVARVGMIREELRPPSRRPPLPVFRKSAPSRWGCIPPWP